MMRAPLRNLHLYTAAGSGQGNFSVAAYRRACAFVRRFPENHVDR
jgi:hypothetical protein